MFIEWKTMDKQEGRTSLFAFIDVTHCIVVDGQFQIMSGGEHGIVFP
jgi:hypothetical protein